MNLTIIEIFGFCYMLQFILLFSFLMATLVDESKSRTDFIWENRLLVVFDPQQSLEQFIELNQEDFMNRKLLVFHFENDTLVNTNFKGKINQESFLDLKAMKGPVWYLLGLDGGIKRNGQKLPAYQKIFRVIDSMPMRQSELKKSGYNFIEIP